MHPRHMKLLDLICQNGRLAVTELSAKLGVSEVTIRKDLNMLAHQGLLKREHGFACMVASDDIGHHLSFHYENKRRIAERAARCVQPGETVMIESGSCCTLLAEELCARDCHITIITNSAFIASFVRKMRSARIILLGGSYQNEAQVMVGPLVGLCARNFKVDKFFLGIDGMDERGVKSSDHLLIEAAQKYGVKGYGCTLSHEQWKKGQERIEALGLQGQVQIDLIDYRDLIKEGRTYDRIVSVGMLEHVGRSNYSVYMETADHLLKDGGLFLLHYISGLDESVGNPWMRKYIFPGGTLPSLREIINVAYDCDFRVIDVESLRRHYYKTLMCWYDNFQKVHDQVAAERGEEFVRMWDLYLCGCAAAFYIGNIDLHQVLMTKGVNNELPMTRWY